MYVPRGNALRPLTLEGVGDPKTSAPWFNHAQVNSADGQWRVVRELPTAWPADVVRVFRARGVLAYGCDWPAGHRSIFASRQAIALGVGCFVFVSPVFLGPSDLDDEPLVQLAVESGTRLVVTHNVRDLKPATRLGVEVLIPREFLAQLKE